MGGSCPANLQFAFCNCQFAMSSSQSEYALRVIVQNLARESDSTLFGPTPLNNKLICQYSCKDASIHIEFRQNKFQFVRVRVIANLFGRGHCCQSCASVRLYVCWYIRIPP